MIALVMTAVTLAGCEIQPPLPITLHTPPSTAPIARASWDCDTDTASINFESRADRDETVSLLGRAVGLPARGVLRVNLPNVGPRTFALGPVNGSLSGIIPVQGYGQFNFLGDLEITC